MRNRKFESVELSFRGHTEFKISGQYFKTLGVEYSSQNPIYTIRTFPEHLMTPDGGQAFPTWTGGWLGFLNKQMEDFNEVHKRWYLSDLTH